MFNCRTKCKKCEKEFLFIETEDHNFPEVYFDVSFSQSVSHELGKETEGLFFEFMQRWGRWHLYGIRYICLHKVFVETNTVRIAVDFGWCKYKIVKSLIKWLHSCNLPITEIRMHSDD